MKKRFFAALLCLCLVVGLLPVTAFAEGEQDSGAAIGTSGLCEHHAAHDESCGYTEGTEETPCAHEHAEDCYTLVTECVHIHTAECYPAESVSENTATLSDAAEPVCAHECSEESGCITKTPDCKHEHDGACGYAPSTEGTPCGFVCGICDGEPEAECLCTQPCTGDSVNTDCPVCGTEGADLTACEGVEAQTATLSNVMVAPSVMALAAAPSGMEIYVGGEQISSTGYWTTDSEGNVTAYTGGGAPSDNYIHYNATTNILTLHNATIKEGLPYSATPPGSLILGAAIGVLNQSGNAELTIQLEDKNTLSETGRGIYVLAPLTGEASLTITGSGSLTANGSQHGIRVQSNNNDATLTIQNADVTATATGVGGDGVYLQSGTSSNASLTVDGGSLTASGDPGIQYSFGGDSVTGKPSLTVSDNALVDARGGGIRAGGSSSAQQVTPATGSSGIVFDGNSGTVYGNVTLQDNLTIGAGESLTPDSGASLNAGGHNVIVNGGTLDDSIKTSLGDSVKYTPAITTTSLPNGTVGTAYSTTLPAEGTTPIKWSLVTGNSLPAGLSLSESGVLSGTPTAEGKSNFIVTATNNYGSDRKQFTLTINAAAATAITTWPSNATVTEGETANFTVAATGSNLTYQWQQSTNSSTWTDISGATAATYTTAAATMSMNGYQYRCVVKGNGGEATSNAATLTVNPVQYTVNFNGNGGTGSMASVTVNKGDVYTLPANEFTAPAGKQFKGWATTAGGSVITDGTITVSADITLYAIWENSRAVPISIAGRQYGAAAAATIGKNVLLPVVNLPQGVADSRKGSYGTHTLVRMDAKKPTCIEAGNIEYWTCKSCGKYFSDANGRTEITLADTVISATGHGKTDTKDAEKATCTEEGYAGDKVCMACGKVVEQGKAIPKLAHNYKNGKCTVCQAIDPDDKEPTDIPQTGDNSNMALWFVLLFISGGAVIVLSVVYVKRRNN